MTHIVAFFAFSRSYVVKAETALVMTALVLSAFPLDSHRTISQ